MLLASTRAANDGLSEGAVSNGERRDGFIALPKELREREIEITMEDGRIFYDCSDASDASQEILDRMKHYQAELRGILQQHSLAWMQGAEY
ncbi:hypothetical protein ACFL6M_02495 [Candidatus Eisenbacteria bacterium]|uniref:AbrB/MazE/SpoVT family DNA-binding domain-containing protein n=1 Tax=Eiseniibacteriota bacterium TaxID=2212470 RepID=A0ABV6YK00_UNCEI